ncbi:MAG: hypothetical protein K9K37_07905 [Desulfocapsa sp.]|nr:hypothetical protein [Desulfocapsa sp.]
MATPTRTGQIRPAIPHRLSHVKIGSVVPIDTDHPNETDLLLLHLCNSSAILEKIIINESHNKKSAEKVSELITQSFNIVNEWVKS